MGATKTNAMRMLDSHSIPYQTFTYESKDGKIDGISVAAKIDKAPEVVYKTLVAVGASKAHYVFVIAVEDELDLKKAAKAAQEKKIEMIAVKDIQKLTGYIRGGCSPIAMKKQFMTIIDEQAKDLPRLIVSAGKIGYQIELPTESLASLTEAIFADVVK